MNGFAVPEITRNVRYAGYCYLFLAAVPCQQQWCNLRCCRLHTAGNGGILHLEAAELAGQQYLLSQGRDMGVDLWSLPADLLLPRWPSCLYACLRLCVIEAVV